VLSRIDYALLEQIERGDAAFAPSDPHSRADAERFNGTLELLLLHEELGLLAVTRTGPDGGDGGAVGASAELTEYGRRRLARRRAEAGPELGAAGRTARPTAG
jgi:hypothetical protein